MPDGANFTADFSGMDKLLREEPGKVDRFLDWMAESIVTDAKLSMGESPSAPGDPPGVDTAALRASITWENTGPHERTISDGVEYGVYLEYGTEKMAARPWMVPAFARAQERMEQDAKDQLGLDEL